MPSSRRVPVAFYVVDTTFSLARPKAVPSGPAALARPSLTLARLAAIAVERRLPKRRGVLPAAPVVMEPPSELAAPSRLASEYPSAASMAAIGTPVGRPAVALAAIEVEAILTASLATVPSH